jgi:hypothetical protein
MASHFIGNVTGRQNVFRGGLYLAMILKVNQEDVVEITIEMH